MGFFRKNKDLEKQLEDMGKSKTPDPDEEKISKNLKDKGVPTDKNK